jgi:ATP-binding cassette subfamily B (MDR/TAP) protein 1
MRKDPILTDRYSVVFAALIASTSISTIVPQITAFTNAAAAASELFSVIDKNSELDPLDESGKKPVDSCDGNIEIQNLAFAYPSRPSTLVLRDFHISIPAGKTTALVGASGSGKSTVVGLLERWYAPLSGSIMLDGIDISEYNTQWLRSCIRLVQQVWSSNLSPSVLIL